MGGRNQADRLRRRKPRTLSTTGMHAPSQAPNHGVVMNPWRVMWCTPGTRPFSQSHREDHFPVKSKCLCPKGVGAEMSCFVTWYGLTCVVGSPPFVPLGPTGSCVVPSWAMRTLVGLPCPNPLRKVLSGRLIALKGVGAAIHSRSPPAPTPLRLLFCFFVPAAGDYTTLYVQYSAFAVTQIVY